jgi:YVTN family beta-propeller protein
MSDLPLRKLPFSSEDDHAYAVLENRLHRQRIISVLLGEQGRIRAWNQIQKKKKDGQYRTKEGKYLRVGSDPICPDESSFSILGMVLELLQAEARAAEKWQEVVYVANWVSNTVSVIATDSQAVIATIQVGECPFGVAITPDGTKVYVTNWDSNNVSVIATDSQTVIATIQVEQGPYGVAIGRRRIWQ